MGLYAGPFSEKKGKKKKFPLLAMMPGGEKRGKPRRRVSPRLNTFYLMAYWNKRGKEKRKPR